MVDTVQTNVLNDGSRRKVVQLLNESDGTGESAVVKLDISGDTGPDGSVPSKYSIQEVEYDIQGFTAVKLYFDATTDDEALYLPAGSNLKSFVGVGGLHDPLSTGATGDVVLTTVGAASGATYDIILHVKKHN